MKKILFLVHTEYQMMVTLSLVADVFYDVNMYKIYIFQTKSTSKNRFNFKKNTNIHTNVNYNEIPYERDIKSNMELILSVSWNIFVLFNHHLNMPVYLAKELFKKGTEIYLAPDGLKVYNESRKVTPRWSFLGALDFYKFIKTNQLVFNWYFPRLTYANLREISKVYVHFPTHFKNYTNKVVVELAVIESERAKKMVSKYFKFNIFKELKRTTNLIFYINQPFNNKKLFAMEIKILSELQFRFPEYEFVIKLHPLTHSYQLELYKKLQNITLINKSYPAELYIAELKKSIVVSFWSTACLINNDNVNLYWMYPVLERENLMLDYVKIKNPTSHIIKVDNVNKIL